LIIALTLGALDIVGSLSLEGLDQHPPGALARDLVE
jgi:hypothetical protein